MSPDLLGTVAAVLTTASFVPQALHVMRSHSVAGISVGMYSIFALGVAFWLAYGIALGAWPIIIANAITLTLACVILGITLVRRRHAG